MVVYLLDFLYFQHMGNQLVGFSATIQPWSAVWGVLSWLKGWRWCKWISTTSSLSGMKIPLHADGSSGAFDPGCPDIDASSPRNSLGSPKSISLGIFSFPAPFPWGSVQVRSCSCELRQRLTELPELGGNRTTLLIFQLKMFLDASSPWNSACQEPSGPLWPSEDSK